MLRNFEAYHTALPEQDGEVPPEQVRGMVRRKIMLFTILPDKGFTATYVAIDTDCLKVRQDGLSLWSCLCSLVC